MLETFAAAQKHIDIVRPQVDVVVGLLHLGDVETSPYTSLSVARETTGLDVIIDGHSHTVLPEGRWENGILIAQAGEYSKYVGVVELELDHGRVVGASARLLDKQALAGVPDKPETRAVFDEVMAAGSIILDRVVGSTTVALNAVRDEVRIGETNGANFMADALREAGGSDVALFLAAYVGGDIRPGDITREDVMTLTRVNAPLGVGEAKGKDIVAALDDITRFWPERHGIFGHVSGMTFTLNGKAAPGTPERISDVRIDGRPLEAERTYSVTTMLFMFKGPGLKNGKMLRRIGTIEDAVIAYLEKHSPVSPTVDGRMTLIR